jgi:hypothetical protein
VHDFSPPDDSSDDLSGSSLSDDSASDGLPGLVGSSSLHPWPRIYQITGVSFASGAPWPSLLEHGGDVRWADHYGLQGTPVAPHAEKVWRRPAKPRHLLVPCPIHSSFLADVFDPVPQVGARGVPNGRLPFSHVPHNVQPTATTTAVPSHHSPHLASRATMVVSASSRSPTRLSYAHLLELHRVVARHDGQPSGSRALERHRVKHRRLP